MRVFLRWIVPVALLVTVVGAVSINAALNNPTGDQRINALSRSIRCPTCNGLSVAESETPMAVSARIEIVARVRAGASDASIKQFFVSRYGESALMSPPAKGSTSLIWILPLVFIAVALGVAFTTARRSPVQAEPLQFQLSSVGGDGEASQLQPTRAHKDLTSRRLKDASTWIAIACAVVCVLVGAYWLSRADGGGNSHSDETVEQLLQRAERQTAQGRPADALKTYDKALTKDPNNANALAYRGWLIRLAGMSKEGETSIDRAIALAPQYGEAHFFKAMILFHDRDDAAGALPQFDACLANHPTSQLELSARSEREKAAQSLQNNSAAKN